MTGTWRGGRHQNVRGLGQLGGYRTVVSGISDTPVEATDVEPVPLFALSSIAGAGSVVVADPWLYPGFQ